MFLEREHGAWESVTKLIHHIPIMWMCCSGDAFVYIGLSIVTSQKYVPDASKSRFVSVTWLWFDFVNWNRKYQKKNNYIWAIKSRMLLENFPWAFNID